MDEPQPQNVSDQPEKKATVENPESLIAHLFKNDDAASHILVDTTGRGLVIADVLETYGYSITRVRKSGNGWVAH